MEDGVRYNAPHSSRNPEARQARQLPVIVNAGDKTSSKLSGDRPVNVAQVHLMQVSLRNSILSIGARGASTAHICGAPAGADCRRGRVKRGRGRDGRQLGKNGGGVVQPFLAGRRLYCSGGGDGSGGVETPSLR